MDKSLWRVTLALFVDKVENIDDSYMKTFSPHEWSLFYDDSRRIYTYFAPERLVLSQDVELDQTLRCVRLESKQEQTEEILAGWLTV